MSRGASIFTCYTLTLPSPSHPYATHLHVHNFMLSGFDGKNDGRVHYSKWKSNFHGISRRILFSKFSLSFCLRYWHEKHENYHKTPITTHFRFSFSRSTNKHEDRFDVKSARLLAAWSEREAEKDNERPKEPLVFRYGGVATRSWREMWFKWMAIYCRVVSHLSLPQERNIVIIHASISPDDSRLSNFC